MSLIIIIIIIFLRAHGTGIQENEKCEIFFCSVNPSKCRPFKSLSKIRQNLDEIN